MYAVVDQEHGRYSKSLYPVVDERSCECALCRPCHVLASASFENSSIITTRKGFPLFVFGRGPRMSITTYCHCWTGRNKHAFGCLLVVRCFLRDNWQSCIVAYTSLAICSQHSCCPVESYIGRRLGCPAVRELWQRSSAQGLSTTGTYCDDTPSTGDIITCTSSAWHDNNVYCCPTAAAASWHSLSSN